MINNNVVYIEPRKCEICHENMKCRQDFIKWVGYEYYYVCKNTHCAGYDEWLPAEMYEEFGEVIVN